MKKISLEIKVSVLLFISVIMILSAGYLTYLNLSTIVSALKDESTPDLRLLSLKELSSDLNDADNSVRLYMVTNEEAYLQPFYKLVQTADDRMERLYHYNIDMPYQLGIIDSIGILVEEKLEVWDELLHLRNDNRVENALNELSEKFLNESTDSISQEEDRGFLKRFFKRKKEEVPPTIGKEELKEEISRLEELRRLDSLANRQMLIRESALLEKNKEISSGLNRLISKIEEEENESLAREAREADELAENTFNWLIIFGISLFLLLVVVFIVIINYVRKTKASQKALSEAKIQAENLAKTKEIFMANVSHEIRTPLNAIYGLSNQLLMQEKTDKEIHNQINVISKSANHLLAIINDILDFSKIQSGKIELEKIHFSPRSIFEEVYQLNVFQAENKGIELKLEINDNIPEAVIGDPVRLKQILLNVINNAIKFTDQGKVIVSASSEKEKEYYRLVMKIKDTGVGIEKDKIDHIFEDFTQEEKSTTRKYGGTGLGLAIVKNLTEMMGGKIDIESEKNKGTIFTIGIPFQEGDITQISYEDDDSEPSDFSGLKVLVVDDEEYNRMVLRLILKKWNVDYKEAVNGNEALQYIYDEHFDLILMDIRMPEMDGIEATRIIRQNKAISPGLRIVGLSATNASEDVEESFAAGMDSFLQKPFNEKSLQKIFDHLVQKIPDNVIRKNKIETNDYEDIIPVDDKPDLEELYRLGDNDREFVFELLKVFIENSANAMDQMDEAFENKDWIKIADTAHRISASCKHMKAMYLLQLLRMIETKARKNDNPGEISILIVKAKEARQKFVLQLEEHMAENKKSF